MTNKHTRSEVHTLRRKNGQIRSRAVLMLIEMFGLGSLGLDRFYEGSMKLGFVKLVLFILGVILSFLTGFPGLILLAVYALFVLWDTVLVIWSSLTLQSTPVFYGTPAGTKWVGGTDDKFARAIAIVTIIIMVANLTVWPYKATMR